LYFKGEYRAAEGHLVRCLEIRERAGSDTLSIAGGLGRVYFAQGDYRIALEWFGRALTGYEKSLEIDHCSTLTTVGNIASVHVNQGDHSKALEWHGRALVGRVKSLGRDHPDTLTSVNMASVYNKQGDKPPTQRATPPFSATLIAIEPQSKSPPCQPTTSL
jgi:tetratricopeptide (TPR) repeat protein